MRGEQITFGRIFPNLWDGVANRESGHLQLNGGMTSFLTIDPLESSAGGTASRPGFADPQCLSWKLAIMQEDLNSVASIDLLRSSFFYLFAAVAAVLGLLAHALVRRIFDARDSIIAELREREQELTEALLEVKQLSGLLPICAGCKAIRDSGGEWSNLEAYVSGHSDVTFTHGLCPKCEQTALAGIPEPT